MINPKMMNPKMTMRLFVLLVSFCLITSSAFGQGKSDGKKTEPPVSKGQTKSDKGAAAAAKAEIIDINSASKQELMTLPGIGDALSQKIIAGRPYKGKDDLVRKNIIPQATYDKISGQIIAKQNTAAPAKKK